MKTGGIEGAIAGWNKNSQVKDVYYDLYLPQRFLENPNPQCPCLVVLPGWDFPRTSWIENTNLTADDIVPESQSRLFFAALQQQPMIAVVEYHPVAGAGHDYPYWGSQLEAVFKFIDQLR